MNLVESLDAHADWLERNADALDAQEEMIKDAYRQVFDECFSKADLNATLDQSIFDDMQDLLSWACMASDQTIHRQMMAVVLRCASEGQPDAVAVFAKVKDYFVDQMMEKP